MAFWRLISRRLKQAGIRDIAVVVRRSQRHLVEGDKLARAVVNRRPGLGMFSSIQCGLRAMPGFPGYLLCPVDHPGVEAQTYERLGERYLKRAGDVVRPFYRGRPGHPIVISEKVAGQVCKASPRLRLDRIISKNRFEVKNIKVNDENVLININTATELSFAREHHRAHTRRRQG